MDAMFAFLGTFSSISTLIGLAQPSSLMRFLPWWGPLLWSVCLLLGCVTWMVGLTSIKENNGHLVLTRMPALILGLYLVSISCAAYAVALVIVAGPQGILAGTSFLAIAAGTYLRRVDFASRFRGDQ
jgi:hypothetical protein